MPISLMQRVLNNCASEVRSSMLNSVALQITMDARDQHQYASPTLPWQGPVYTAACMSPGMIQVGFS